MQDAAICKFNVQMKNVNSICKRKSPIASVKYETWMQCNGVGQKCQSKCEKTFTISYLLFKNRMKQENWSYTNAEFKIGLLSSWQSSNSVKKRIRNLPKEILVYSLFLIHLYFGVTWNFEAYIVRNQFRTSHQ
jgi:hypothetical protein